MQTTTGYDVRWCDGFPVVLIDGHGQRVTRLLGDGDGNTKLRKNTVETAGLSLSAHKSAGLGNLCPFASDGCVNACLDHQGLASVFANIRRSRMAKTVLWYQERNWFFGKLRAEITAARGRAQRAGSILAVRLNVFSDVPWERYSIIGEFPGVQFYDYTKNPQRGGTVRPNYWLTFSRSETNESDCLRVLESAGNVAVVFADESIPATGNRSHLQRLPKSWRGFPVIDGDESDVRFDDPRGRTRGRVVGLRLKAHSRTERLHAIDSGFAVRI